MLATAADLVSFTSDGVHKQCSYISVISYVYVATTYRM